MVRNLIAGISFFMFAGSAAMPAQATTIAYEVSAVPSASQSYVYTYHLSGQFGDGDTLNLLFDAAHFANVSLDWSSLAGVKPDWLALDGAVEPLPLLPADGLLQLLALAEIHETDGTFRIAFDWSGAGLPGAQPFELIDSAGNLFLTGVTTGFTPTDPNEVPEPGTVLLLAGGAIVLLRHARRRPLS
jgi:hypothetical protein